MTTSTGTVEPFRVVTAAHHFLLDVLPFRDPDSYEALATFTAAMERIRPPVAELDAVLLRCLVVMDMQPERRIPSLVERYLAKAVTPDGSLAHFATCVEDLLRYRRITNGVAQQALNIIRTRFGEPSVDPRTIADAIHVRLSTLDVIFKREMGCTITEHIRDVRLERSALLLVTTKKSIKEIWAEVGYNHHSNFDHEFKRRFGMPPRQFRAGAFKPVLRSQYGVETVPIAHDAPASFARGKSVLIVDDDDTTRWTLGTYLSRQGYSVSTAPTGHEGLLLVKSGHTDVVLLDYRLGDMDGFEFLRLLRRHIPGDSPAVALFTADRNAFARCEDINALNAVLASKLCDLTHITKLIDDLGAPDNLGDDIF